MYAKEECDKQRVSIDALQYLVTGERLNYYTTEPSLCTLSAVFIVEEASVNINSSLCFVRFQPVR